MSLEDKYQDSSVAFDLRYAKSKAWSAQYNLNVLLKQRQELDAQIEQAKKVVAAEEEHVAHYEDNYHRYIERWEEVAAKKREAQREAEYVAKYPN